MILEDPEEPQRSQLKRSAKMSVDIKEEYPAGDSKSMFGLKIGFKLETG